MFISGKGSGVVYLQPEEEEQSLLPEVNFKRLRRLPNSLVINPATQGWNWIAQPLPGQEINAGKRRCTLCLNSQQGSGYSGP